MTYNCHLFKSSIDVYLIESMNVLNSQQIPNDANLNEY